MFDGVPAVSTQSTAPALSSSPVSVSMVMVLEMIMSPSPSIRIVPPSAINTSPCRVVEPFVEPSVSMLNDTRRTEVPVAPRDTFPPASAASLVSSVNAEAPSIVEVLLNVTGPALVPPTACSVSIVSGVAARVTAPSTETPVAPEVEMLSLSVMLPLVTPLLSKARPARYELPPPSSTNARSMAPPVPPASAVDVSIVRASPPAFA